ncbi:hypothetical protein OROHE_006934 [Orobanche hederae]
MDLNWIKAPRLSEEYKIGVKQFCNHAINHAKDISFILCPCQKCLNIMEVNGPAELYEHLMLHGIDKTYTCWIYRGEKRGELNSSNLNSSDQFVDIIDTDVMEDNEGVSASVEKDFPNLINEGLRDHPDMNEKLKDDAALPLWPGCTKASRLSAVLTLYNLKVGHQISDVFFTEMLTAVSELLPNGNVLPRRAYDAKQMLKSIGLVHNRIHACPNDCILYRKEYAQLDECPKCSVKCFKDGNSPAKVMWYFPIIPRFRRLFGSVEDSKHLTWHHDERIKDGMLRHPADSPQWKTFDDVHQDFGKEPRNLRLALSTDGMNLHHLQSCSHSTWPVILIIYNLAPGLCMKRKYMMMSTLISGPIQPGNDIDVYLAPLTEDLKLLWEEGIEVHDRYRNDHFRLKAMLFGTISDFPAYSNLSGYSVKGYDACPLCAEETDNVRLKHCKKCVYMGHRRWLESNNRYRKMTVAFNGEVEERRAPPLRSGIEVFKEVENLNIQFGKKFSKDVPSRGWKKHSIFFDLPYWKELYVGYFIDLMHVQKNVFDSLIGTLLGVPGKTKDGHNARMDMMDMGIRSELAPVEQPGKKPYLPPAAHTLSRNEKKVLLQTLHSVKVPEGYSSNIKSLVDLDDLKLKGLKSHDCHVIIENLLPIAIRSILPEKVTWNDLGQPIGKESTALSHFIGSYARRNIPITCDNWCKKDWLTIKQALWDEVKDKNGNYSKEPPTLYAHLSTVAPYWKEFVENATKEEFVVKSKQNKERAEGVEARYRKACLGYARIREIIMDKKIKAGEKNPVVTRLDAWEYARQNADGVVDDPATLEILEDVVVISNQLSEHELTNIGTDDLLARLIPLEYAGRMSKLKSDISFLKNEIKELKRNGYILGVQSGGSSHMDNFDIDDDVDGEHDDNHDHVLSEDLPQGKSACYLYVEPGRRNVGRGILWNDVNDRMLHGVPLEEGYVRVQFEVAVPTEANTRLPRPCDEANRVGEAPGYFLAWPRKLVSLKLEAPPKTKNKEKIKDLMAQEKVKDKEKTVESIADVSSRQLGYPLPQDVSHDGVVELVRLAMMFDRVTDIEIEMDSFWDGDPWTEHIHK